MRCRASLCGRYENSQIVEAPRSNLVGEAVVLWDRSSPFHHFLLQILTHDSRLGVFPGPESLTGLALVFWHQEHAHTLPCLPQVRTDVVWGTRSV